MSRFLGIDFAPIHLPLKRRLQTLAVFMVGTEFLFFGVWSTIFLILLLFTPFFLIPVAYFTWILYDKETYNKGMFLCNIRTDSIGKID
ncbi:diacylglycerol O-acyltransferase-like protein [Leptotrombidium deliense]|uniref:Diacylglycerol O-acyltransferase-like protein n=1 Tax=Leptotrombidium deliense TaxID=299467 RepID=A0A443S9Y7_9ACAR|nr:diacylglycerol O-acyltransferase-like protein [Leptotrombidium deliense]